MGTKARSLGVLLLAALFALTGCESGPPAADAPAKDGAAKPAEDGASKPAADGASKPAADGASKPAAGAASAPAPEMGDGAKVYFAYPLNGAKVLENFEVAFGAKGVSVVPQAKRLMMPPRAIIT